MRTRAILVVAAAMGLGGGAWAETEKNGAQGAAEAPARSMTCIVSGTTAVASNTLVYDRAQGGQAIARLSGAPVPLSLFGFPAGMKGRARVQTSRGKSAVRIEGFLKPADLRFFAARDLALVGGHVWLTGGMPLELVGATAAGFTVRHRILGSDGQALEASVPCNAVSLELVPVISAQPPKNARTYQMKTDTLTLYDRPRGEEVFTLRMKPEARRVFWSSEARGGFLHVMARADITIDAWARVSDLSALRHDELFDLDAIAPKPLQEPRVALQDPPDVLTANAELPIHRHPENAKATIGVVEPGARFYPLEQSGAWTNIMPEGLAVLPSDGGGFWVRTSGLPKP